MTRQKSLSNWLLLGAIFFGLNLLCFMCIAHGRGVEHHTRVNYSHVPVHRTGRVRSCDEWSGTVIVYDSLIDHASQIPNADGKAAGAAATPHAALGSAGSGKRFPRSWAWSWSSRLDLPSYKLHRVSKLCVCNWPESR